MKQVLYSIFLCVFCLSCIEKGPSFVNLKNNTPVISTHDKTPKTVRDSSCYEKLFIKNGLINISEMDSNIRVCLMYNCDKNFIGKSFYKGLDQCYLPCEVATKLNNAQKYLKRQFPLYNLIVFDATRPAHIQKMMWDSLKLHPLVKYDFLARPDEISLHNYGAAVDVSIIGENGKVLNMGTEFDYFGDLARPSLEPELFAAGKLSKEAYCNRLLLRKVMVQAGFYPITSEWWHFNACNKTYAAINYKLID